MAAGKPKAKETQTLTPIEFSHTITKIAVSQICQSIGFKSTQSSAIDTLTRITALYLQSIAKYASSHASLSGNRTQCNLFDIINAIEELHLPITKPGSKTLNDLRHFVRSIDELPFARRVPRNSNSSSVMLSPTLFSMSRPEVPKWLPEFPCLERTGAERVLKRGVWWEDEEKSFDDLPLAVSFGAAKGTKMFVYSRRRRHEKVKVKFKLGLGTRSSSVGLNGLELRNGVCRGGKRVCLVQSLKNTFFHDDQEETIK